MIWIEPNILILQSTKNWMHADFNKTHVKPLQITKCWIHKYATPKSCPASTYFHFLEEVEVKVVPEITWKVTQDKHIPF